jgi:hypothetical protein
MMAGSEDTKLDDTTVRKLESSLPQKAKELYEHVKSKTTITLHDATKDNKKEQVKAYTRYFDGHCEIWLTSDHVDIFDSFIHELGQVNVLVLGYKNLQPKASYDARQAKLNGELAAFASNAFIFYVCEHELEKWGIDRSRIKQRSVRHFEDVLNKLPPVNHPDHSLLKEPYQRALLCYEYVPTRLFLGTDFDRFEALWREKIRYSNLKYRIRTIYLEASKQEITPERYNYLQKFFARTLELDIFT